MAPFPPAEVVESLLLSVQADPESHEVIFRFRTPSGHKEFGLRSTGVSDLSVNGFLRQNIVHEVRILGKESQAQTVRDLLATLLFDDRAASQTLEPALRKQLDDSARLVLEGRKLLVEIEPVYGRRCCCWPIPSNGSEQAMSAICD